MIADILLVAVGFLGLLIGSISDLRTREVPDWMNYAMIAAGLGIRLLHSLVNSDWAYTLYGLIGLGVMLVIGNLLYYSKQWGGGDTKLLIALGVIFATRPYFIETNYPFLIVLFANTIFFGAIYGFAWGVFLAFKHRKSFMKHYRLILGTERMKSIKLIIVFLIIAFVLSLFAPSRAFPIIIGALAVFSIAYTYSWALMKAVEDSCMCRVIPVSKLTIGDWVVNKEIKNKYNISDLGVEKPQLDALKNSKLKSIEIKEGIPFVPSFLIGFLATLISGKLFLLF